VKAEKPFYLKLVAGAGFNRAAQVYVLWSLFRMVQWFQRAGFGSGILPSALRAALRAPPIRSRRIGEPLLRFQSAPISDG